METIGNKRKIEEKQKVKDGGDRKKPKVSTWYGENQSQKKKKPKRRMTKQEF